MMAYDNEEQLDATLDVDPSESGDYQTYIDVVPLGNQMIVEKSWIYTSSGRNDVNIKN